MLKALTGELVNEVVQGRQDLRLRHGPHARYGDRAVVVLMHASSPIGRR